MSNKLVNNGGESIGEEIDNTNDGATKKNSTYLASSFNGSPRHLNDLLQKKGNPICSLLELQIHCGQKLPRDYSKVKPLMIVLILLPKYYMQGWKPLCIT